ALTDKQKRDFVAALDGDIYRNLPKARMALVLRLESLVRAPGVQLQNAVSLEHVLPQNPPDGSDWIKWFPDEDERDCWTHRLANLVPLDRNKNSSASNYDFSKKKDAYFRGKGKASPFVLTQEVRSENEWTPNLLAERQKRLMGELKNHWKLAVTTDNASASAAN
ncbi:HNH endonuclease, partial [Escherichia coli]|nr:HNH endonuclease [Escherichia coli]